MVALVNLNIMIYLKIETNFNGVDFSKIQKILIKILFFIFPVANPDFEDIFDLVEVWLLEFEEKDKVPFREIGLDINGNVIAKMPYLDNYGYWTDNNFKYTDFISKCKYTIISKEEFENEWDSFEL